MLYGHKDKITLFERLIKSDRVSHAYLFFGDSGIGKFLFAKLLGCYVETGKWDSNHTLIDTREFFPAKDKIFIGIDEAREIKAFLWSTPLASSKRVAIINNAHLLTSEAQSAMLKIVEEPPKHALIIFISHDPSVFGTPLLSRLIKIYFTRFSKVEIADFLRTRDVSQKKCDEISVKSYGRIARALELLHNHKDTEEENMFEKNILNLRENNNIAHSRKILWLLEKEANIKRFRLNRELQKKSIQEFLCRP